MKNLSILATILVLTACGGTNTEKENDTTVSDTSSSSKSQKAALSTAAIDMDAAFYDGPTEYTKIAPCPFLTDKTAMGAYKRLYDLDSSKQERTSVSNTECYWSYVNVRIPSEKDATYQLNNLKKYDGEQAFKPQSGPGKEAFVYYSKLRNKKKQTRPDGFIFSQNGKTIFISGSASSEPTSIKNLRETADEIARLLPDSPEIKRQSKTIIHRFNACDVWNKETLASVLEADKIFLPMMPGGYNCNYSFTSKGVKPGIQALFELHVSFNKKGKKKKDKDSCDYLIEKGAKQEKGFSQKVVSKTFKSTTSYDPSSESVTSCFGRGSFDIFISGPDLRYSKQSRLLLKNLLSRISESGVSK